MRRYFMILLDVCLVLLSTIVALALRENFALTEDLIEASLPYLGELMCLPKGRDFTLQGSSGMIAVTFSGCINSTENNNGC